MVTSKKKIQARQAREAASPSTGFTKKQRQRLAKQRAACEADQVRLQVETGTTGGVRPAREPTVPYRDLRPKGGFFTKGQKSGPLTKA